MTEAMPFLQKYDITFLRPPTIRPGLSACVCCKGEGEMGEFFVILGTVISYRRNTSKS